MALKLRIVLSELRIGVCWSIFQRPRQPINRSPQRPSSKDRRRSRTSTS